MRGLQGSYLPVVGFETLHAMHNVQGIIKVAMWAFSTAPQFTVYNRNGNDGFLLKNLVSYLYLNNRKMGRKE